MQDKKASAHSVPARLRELRTALGLKWDQLALRLEVSQSMIYLVLRGERNLGDLALTRLEQLEVEADLRVCRSGVGKRLKWLRESKGLTTAQLGKASGIPQRMIEQVEAESLIDPPKEFVEAIAKNLEASSGWLAWGEGMTRGLRAADIVDFTAGFAALQFCSREELQQLQTELLAAEKGKPENIQKVYQELWRIVSVEAIDRIPNNPHSRASRQR